MTVFQAGGALNPDDYGHLIVHRPELDRIENHLSSRDLYIALRSPRQTGKTTLLFQLSTRLAAQNCGVVHLDLEGLSDLDSREFYQTICEDIQSQLGDQLNTDVDYAPVNNQMRFSDYLRSLSAHTPQARKLIMMLDELEGVPDSVASPFFASLRRFYHRGQNPSVTDRQAYRKITFVFAGALGLQRLSLGENSPLRNICQPFTLADFSRQQVSQLSHHLNGYPDDCVAVLADEVHRWCDGHPYLTQCLYALIDASEACRAATVDQLPAAVNGLVESAFLYGDDANISHIFNNHLRPTEAYHRPVREIFEGSRKSTIIAEDLISLGIVKRSSGNNLTIRNRIYEERLNHFFNDIKGEAKMDAILSGVLANGLYDIVKRGIGRLSPQSPLYQYLKERQWERLYQDGELLKQIERYRTERGPEALEGIDAALQKILQKDADLAASFQKIQTSQDALREVMTLTAAENTRDANLPQAERFSLIQQLNGLPPEQLDIIIFTVNPPPGIIPPASASVGSRTPALLNWAEGTGGCGLDQVQQVLEGLINPR